MNNNNKNNKNVEEILIKSFEEFEKNDVAFKKIVITFLLSSIIIGWFWLVFFGLDNVTKFVNNWYGVY